MAKQTVEYLKTRFETGDIPEQQDFVDLIDTLEDATIVNSEILNRVTADTALQSSIALKAPLASPTFTGTVSGITKDMVGLGSVDNTTDLLKPISTATQTALNLKADKTELVGLQTATQVDARISTLIGTAPANLDTLGEIATQLSSDESAVASLVTTVAGKEATGVAAGLITTHNSTFVHSDIAHTNRTALNAVTGTNTGDETVTTIKTKLGITTLSGANTGDQVIPTTLPASDVSAWAKAATKPTYTATEVGLGNVPNLTFSGSNTGDETVTTIKSKLGIATLSGSNTGDETVTTIKSKLGITTLSGSNTGDQVIPTTLPASDVSAWAKETTKPVYTKTEVGLSNVDNTADVLKPVATTTVNGIMSAVDKVKLNGIATGATNYVHPVNHPASVITQDASNRFVTDAEKTIWNSSQTALGFTPENTINKNVANGYAPLDSGAKIPTANLPDAILGAMKFKAVWDASTNTPAIPIADVTNTGWYYVVNVSGSTSVSGISDWVVGDWIVSNGSLWAKVDNTDSCSSVFGRTGAILANAGDYTTDKITETVARVFVTPAQKTVLSNTSNTNTGDETLTTIKTKLGITTLSGSNTGDQVIPTTLPASDVSAWAKEATKPVYTKTEVGLSLVDNTSDVSKPVSTAQATAIALKANLASPTFTGVPVAPTAVVGTNTTQLATTAFVQAYDDSAKANLASPTFTGTVSGITAAMVGLGSVNNTADVSKPVATTTVNGIMSSTDKVKLDGIAISANNYVHPTGDGNSHIPITSTTNSGKVLVAGATANSFSWNTLDMTYLPDAAFKKSVRVATTANIGASFAAGVITGPIGVLVIDAITVALNDRILVKDQTATLQNGIYYVSTLGTASVAWVLTRTAGANISSELAGALVNVDSGTQGGFLFDTDFKSTDVINTTAVTWNRIMDTGLASTVVGTAAGTAAIGTSLNYARQDHVHPTDTTKAAIAQTMYIGTTATTINRASAAQTIAGLTLTTPNIGVATGTSFNGITGLATVAPLIAGTAAVGVATVASRQDHVHPAQTTITGTAGGLSTNLPVTNLNSGTNASVSTYWRGDGTWATVIGGSTVDDDTTTNATYYPSFATTIGGTALKCASSKYTFNPSSGTLYATVFNSSSDERLKNDIAPITNALETIEKLDGKSFTWKSTGEKSYGFIAQELEMILPELVTTAGDGMKSVNYDATIAILLEAIKTLNNRITELEK